MMVSMIEGQLKRRIEGDQWNEHGGDEGGANQSMS